MRSIARLLLPALFLAAALPSQIQHLSARLTGSQSVPPVATAAVGWSLVWVDPASGRVDVFVHANGIAATAAHLHGGAPGVNGGVVLPLAGGPATWTGSGVVAAAQIAAILAGDTYVNLHTPANPGGEIRGQVEATVATRFTVRLDGSQEVPPNGSNATGVMTAFLHEPDRVLVYEMNVSGLSGTASHIHRGGPGVGGPVVFPLNGGGTRWCGVTPRFSDADLAALMSGDLYVNVHTAAVPGGEIRGQLLSDDADFEASLGGGQAVPPVATAARGEACVFVNADRSVTYFVRAAGLVGTAAHFHRGAPGVIGPVVIPLVGGPNVWQGVTAPLTVAQLADLRGGNWYVNVHTAVNPAGEIRGQVFAAKLPITYGGGCPITGGAAPEIGASGAACIGAMFDVSLFGAPASRPAIVVFGTNRDVIPGGGHLPLSLVGLGAPDCFLLHDNFGFSLAAATDALGCAKTGLTIPFVPGLAATLQAQWFVLAPGANPLGIATSNGLEFRTQ